MKKTFEIFVAPLIAFCALTGAAQGQANETAALPTGEAVISAPAGDSKIVIKTTARLAGAIGSLTWNGKQFIDQADHGRELQSASNFDCGGEIFNETFNPTEAGSRRDGAGPTSTSRLLHLVQTESKLQTTTQMAFWLAPGETSGGNVAKNRTTLSNHLLTKRVQIGYRDMPQVVPYDVTFSVPLGEHHTLAVFEVLTGYMPPEFSRFLGYNVERDTLVPLSDGPGEQTLPVVLATDDGQYAMGCWTPETAAARGAGWSGPGYGRFRYEQEQVVKWNCVFRLRQTSGVPAGEYAFRVFVVVGDLATVQQSLRKLTSEFAER